MPSQWSFGDTVAEVEAGSGSLVLVEGDSFCISAVNGDIRPGAAHGLFDRDTRFLSQLELMLNDGWVQPLSLLPSTPFSAGALGRMKPPPGRADSSVLVFRHRYVGRGMREDLVLQNLASEPAAVTVTLLVDADFAHIFEVKEQRVVARGERTVQVAGSSLTYDYSYRDLRRAVTVTLGAPETFVTEGTLSVAAVVPARGEWRTCLQVTPAMDDGPVRPHYRCGEALERAEPLRRMRRWKSTTPKFRSDHEGFDRMAERAEEDLGALRIFDPEFPDRAVVAAGAPWFMTLFGRDSLITSWMALLADPSLAEGTLRTLARYQGSKVDALSEEEPGRIPHELRWGVSHSLARGSGSLYYGSIDATPLFVMVLGELRRWGLAAEAVEELLPAVDRALAWVEEYGDRDGDGFVEYKRATDQGLVNQGWKDSWDGISNANGRLPEAPIALCEVQGYVYAAYLARAHFAGEGSDNASAQRWADKAAALKTAFNRDFWMPEEGYFAVGLDGHKAPIDSITSNVGHCLWTGIVDEDKAPAVVERLLATDMFSGFGLRTLSSEMGAYNPVSYHNGSVWPHDTALAIAGLVRYGFDEAAQRLMLGLIDAVDAFDGRPPELFSGLSRDEFPVPVPYPTACSPQAWSSGSVLSLARSMLRLDPWIPQNRLWLSPDVPAEIGRLQVSNIPMGPSRLAITADGDRVEVKGLPEGVQLTKAARNPMHEVFLRQSR